MIRAFLNRWAARRLSAVAHERHASDRDRIRAKARAMRQQLGLPEMEILK